MGRAARRKRAAARGHQPRDPERGELWLPAGWTQADFLASTERLRAAGLIESVSHDLRTGDGEIRFTPEAFRLLQAGRRLFEEPSFVAAWLTADPLIVRAWLRAEASAIEGDPPVDSHGEGRERASQP